MPQIRTFVPTSKLPPSGYLAPALKLDAFTCAWCKAYSQQDWVSVQVTVPGNQASTRIYHPEIKIARCVHCQRDSIWNVEALIFPVFPMPSPFFPNADLDPEIQKDFQEAAIIVNQSPRGAAALLRLCLQKLCVQLGESGSNINADIGNLVKKGLDARVQKALDVVRVVGNQAVHPGVIDLNDTPEIARELFRLVNLIADIEITQRKHLDALYASLPQAQLDGIAVRDK